eukprot:COSAG05_NODE_14967_length_382_cov_0.544170_1_plen_96_part_10
MPQPCEDQSADGADDINVFLEDVKDALNNDLEFEKKFHIEEMEVSGGLCYMWIYIIVAILTVLICCGGGGLVAYKMFYKRKNARVGRVYAGGGQTN